MAKAVFAGCARSCAPFLEGVLANVESLGATYDAFDLIIVENDSEDDTRRVLRDYAAPRPHVRLIEADGLAARLPRRTERIAAARNLYLSAVGEAQYDQCDDLVLLDFDDVNCRPIEPSTFAAARRWLWARDERCGVFANSRMFYYDVWALRHARWSPDDCWARVREDQARIGEAQAIYRHLCTRQIPIAPRAAPIAVDSAFGGLAIYKRAAALRGVYAGLDEHGEETCEHVAFNAAVKGHDGVLSIFPALRNEAPPAFILSSLPGNTLFEIQQSGRKCQLAAPSDHPLQSFRAIHPLYDRRLPELARMISAEAPKEMFIDVGANIGDSVALARLAGAQMPAIAIEASLSYAKYLWANSMLLPHLFQNTRIVWGFVGTGGVAGQVSIGAGTGSAAGTSAAGLVETGPGVRLGPLTGANEVALVKTDTDGFDQDIFAAELEFLTAKKPVLWLEAHTMTAADEAKWRGLLKRIAEDWPTMILFDNFGFAVVAGLTTELGDHAADLMAYGRRQRERAGYRPTLYYLDIALFPKRFEHVYAEFCKSLAELQT